MNAIEGLNSIRYRRPLPGASQFDRANPWCFVGTRAGIMRSRNRRGALVAPVDADPQTFEWPVKGLSVFVVNDAGPEQAGNKIGEAMIRDGAELVVVSTMKGDQLVAHRYMYGRAHPSVAQLEANNEPLF
jgi:hypothetical protein